MKLLLIEDDQQLTSALQPLLRDAGYALEIADNGIDGEFLGNELQPDLIILDLGLPGDVRNDDHPGEGPVPGGRGGEGRRRDPPADRPSGLGKDWDAERKKAQKFKGSQEGLADQKRYDW